MREKNARRTRATCIQKVCASQLVGFNETRLQYIHRYICIHMYSRWRRYRRGTGRKARGVTSEITEHEMQVYATSQREKAKEAKAAGPDRYSSKGVRSSEPSSERSIHTRHSHRIFVSVHVYILYLRYSATSESQFRC